MEINLETKVLWYSIELTSCIGTKHKIKLQASKYVDISQQHKRTQFLLNETRNIMYNLETNELEIWYYGDKDNDIKIQFDSSKNEYRLITLFLRSLFEFKGYTNTQTEAIDKKIKRVSSHYFPTIYLLLFGETTYCDDIYLPEREGE